MKFDQDDPQNPGPSNLGNPSNPGTQGNPNDPQVQYVQQVYVPRSTSGLAIASMVLGILWIYWVGSILAVVFGHIALSQCKQDPNLGGKGMAIAGVVLGWIGVAFIILAIIGGILSTMF